MDTAAVNPKEQLSRIAVYSEDLAQKMNEIVWTLNVSNDSLQNLIAYMRRYAVKYLDDVGIECSFRQPATIPGNEVDGATRRHIFLLLKESLNNVVKHAHASKVAITIAVNGKMQIIIHDNGNGIPVEIIKQTTGNGLKNMQQRIKELGGTMEMTNQAGTLVQFNLPVPGTNTKR
jgi:signal transduction histidine kinase